ncbi:hypothetical protein [Paenibacillus macquariensis]|uniref:Uncharacterized protein n=1 Tax=Paenibacillus macquariensis TaxID=948756 RepID=A0ABY1K4P5_9BACL|nr:hypothetical protein [Paenibacillus macquariensis]MEC0089038.1 hypothetical protein [Paenibacillus macquariensis]OAB31830.1 hypothetical protein PMSM_18500 [Paenibacillus macquariensis subsp. macquariensis]SIR24907.1 hypothetical protein SAMN05421578_109153 [Paenibacillus macquariensis]
MVIGNFVKLTLDVVRNIIYLIISLFFLGMIEKPIFGNEGIQSLPTLGLLLIANLALIYVFHRNFLSSHTFYKPHQKPKLPRNTSILIGIASVAVIVSVPFL